MTTVLIRNKVDEEGLNQAKKDYGEYIKVVVDIKTKLITIGGEWHAGGEKILIANGSKQSDLWGGGINLKNQQFDYTALINIRGQTNPSHVIMDVKIREKFDKIVREKLNL
ncbi:MAG: DUF5674 family protein [Candidatus Beckwithbacteria bacterium]|nr:DUF5674 family protein [Candidatus Beckwithbacteria bacterium]